MTKSACMVACIVLASMAPAAEPPAPPKFAKPPSVAKVGDKVKIEFAVDRETDVAVYVLDAKGEVVRHLVAGVLGKAPPEPLQANSLDQSIEWDGRDDDGRPAAGGPFKVRVAAGLTPKHGGYLLEDEGTPYTQLGTVNGIGVAPDGSIYAIIYRGVIRAKGTFEVQRFTRDGVYAGTVLPFAGNLKPEDVKGLAVFQDERGGPLPRFFSHVFSDMPYLPAEPLVQGAAVDDQGRLRMMVGAFRWEGGRYGVATVGPDGSVRGSAFSSNCTYAAPLGAYANAMELGLVLSEPAPGTALLAGMKKAKDKKDPVLHAVFRVPLEGEGKMEPVFGDPESSGSDEKHLKEPCGLATDGKGRVYVADTGNDRVVVFEEQGGKWLGAIPVTKPYWVGVHHPTGAVYVQSVKEGFGEVLKFAGWQDAKVVARLALPAVKTITPDWRKRLWVLALDAKGKTPRLWLGQCNNPEALRVPFANQLAYCDDLGDKFSDLQGVGPKPEGKFGWAITSDPTHRHILFGRGHSLMLLDDRTGEVKAVKGGGCMPKLGPDGLVYGMSDGLGIRRCTLDGKNVPFAAVKPGAWAWKHEADGRPAPVRELAKGEHLQGGFDLKGTEWAVIDQSLPNLPSGTSGCERDFTIDRKGNIYVKNRGKKYHGSMKVDVYDKDGKYLRTAVWEASDGAYGPRLDAAGNLYLAEGVTLAGGYVPEALKSVAFYKSYYGSVVKFGAAGGAAWRLSPEQYQDNFGFAPPKLGLKQETVTMITGARLVDGKTMEGALWWRPGYSVYQNVVGSDNCHCLGHIFDTDDFGRAFFPDALGFRVGVLDANGNELARIGGYGNRDNRGPSSWVRDPKTGGLRPRQAGDSKDPASPHAQPEIAFAYLNSVAVTDRHAYTIDALSQRVTRIRLDYAADSTCEVR